MGKAIHTAIAFGLVTGVVLTAVGVTFTPMFTMLACWCLFRVAYIIVAVRFIPELTTVSFAYPITWILSSAVLLIYFLKADWIHNFDRMEAAGQL